MKVSELLEEVRTELEDNIKSRWSDDKLLSFLKRAVRRVNHILVRNEIEVGKSEYDFTAQVGISEYGLPVDYMSSSALYNLDLHEPLTHRTSEQWERIYASAPVSNWIVKSNSLHIVSTPTVDVNLRFVYWPTVDAGALKLTSYMPWDGKLDDAILEYLCIRAKNTDEMNITVDAQLTKDLETYIISTFKGIDPLVVDSNGWTGE